MKRNILKIGFLLFSSCFLFSCNESHFLEEKPLDFLSPENAYNTYDDYQTALNGLYARVRMNFYSGDDVKFIFFLDTDVAHNARRNNDRMGNIKDWATPQQADISNLWDREYKLINNANTVISRLKDCNLTDEQKALVQAEAKFFRAFGYRTLVYLFGGVPLILEENTSAKTDYVRDTKDAVIQAMYEDFLEAANVLPHINDVADGKVSGQVAKHYLAEGQFAPGSMQPKVEAIIQFLESGGKQALVTDPAHIGDALDGKTGTWILP